MLASADEWNDSLEAVNSHETVLLSQCNDEQQQQQQQTYDGVAVMMTDKMKQTNLNETLQLSREQEIA